MPVLVLIRCVFFFFLFTKLISVIPQTRPEKKKNLINIFIVLVLVRKWFETRRKKKVPRENYSSPPTVISHYFELFFFSTSRSKLTRSPASLCSQFSLLQPPQPIQKKNRNNQKKAANDSMSISFFFSFLIFYLSNWKHSA